VRPDELTDGGEHEAGDRQAPHGRQWNDRQPQLHALVGSDVVDPDAAPRIATRVSLGG
jgi:hypothetical protein